MLDHVINVVRQVEGAVLITVSHYEAALSTPIEHLPATLLSTT